MIGNFLRVTIEELELYLKDSSLLEKRVYSPSSSDDQSYLDIGRSWEGISFLLTGYGIENIEDAAPPLSWLIIPENIIDKNQNIGYGPANYLLPEQVKDLNQELQKISDDDLRNRFDGKGMNKKGIYPEIWEEEDALGFLLEHFVEIKDFYEKAAKENHAVINFIS
jgi:hypothetical protein